MSPLLNHPVHITDKAIHSSFIPLCFYGEQQAGKVTGQFQDPVCDIFREKVVGGQVCYETDLNRYRKRNQNWEDLLQKGFIIIVDTNEEYDVRNLFERRGYKDKRVELRQQAADRRLSVRLKTISIVHD